MMVKMSYRTNAVCALDGCCLNMTTSMKTISRIATIFTASNKNSIYLILAIYKITPIIVEKNAFFHQFVNYTPASTSKVPAISSFPYPHSRLG